MSTNCWAAATVATAAGLPPSIRCSTVESRPRSRARPAVVDSTSALTPVAAAARSASRPATTSAAATNRCFSTARASSGTSGWSPSGRRTAPEGRMTGPRATPGTTGVPVSTTGPAVAGSDVVPEVVLDMGTSLRAEADGSGRRSDQSHDFLLTCQRNPRKTT
jgi:hypothetical protein